jgi:hypothetical protein
LLDEACMKARGNERNLALEQRWGQLLIKILQAAHVEQLCVLASGLIEHTTLLELALHPHASQVMQAVLRQIAALLSLPDVSFQTREGEAVQQLVRQLYDAAQQALLSEDALQQLLSDARGSIFLRELASLAAGFTPATPHSHPNPAPPPSHSRAARAAPSACSALFCGKMDFKPLRAVETDPLPPPEALGVAQ